MTPDKQSALSSCSSKFSLLSLLTYWVLGAVLVLAGCHGTERPSDEVVATTRAELLGIGYASAFWRFEDCGSGSTLVDSSGNGLNGTKSGGVSCVRGRDGSGVLFNGSTGLVQVPDNPAFHFSNAVTLSAWVKPTNVQGLRTIVNKWFAPDSYMLLINNSKFEFSVGLTTGTVTVNAGPAAANVWTHVAGVFNGSTATLYINGNPVASAPAVGALRESNRPICIGSCPSWNAFAGTIDDVWLSNEPYNQIQVQRLAFGGRASIPAASWRFDDCSSGNPTLVDSTGHDHHGSKIGGVSCAEGFARQSAEFNGANSYVQVPDDPEFHFAYGVSIAAWVKPTAVGGLRTILNKWYSPDSYMLLIHDGRYEFSVGLTTGNVTVSAGGAVPGVWTHVAGVFNGSSITLYVNGVAVASRPAPGTLRQSNRPICIGSCPSWNAFSGRIDEVWLTGQALTQAQVKRLAYNAWPNAQSSATSDAWLQQHHDDLGEMRPRVLALNFTNQEDRADARGVSVNTLWQADLQDIVGAQDESTRYRGYRDPTAQPFLRYEIVKAVDFGDQGSPPPGWNHRNSSKTPIKCDGLVWDYQFDYGALFNSTFAQAYGFVDPSTGQYLELCDLVERGMIHEVWVYYNGRGDGTPGNAYPPYDCPDGTTLELPDQREVLESKQKYDPLGQPMPGQFDACAGNGCFTRGDEAIVAACGRSLRILGMSSESPLSAMHNLGHGIDQGMMNGSVPYFTANLRHFLNMDLDTRLATPFSSWYGLCPGPCIAFHADGSCMTRAPCVDYTSQNSLDYSNEPGTVTGSIAAYDQGCGNTHFPPNAHDNYDENSPQPVLASCEFFGWHNGPGGADLQTVYTNANANQYSIYGSGWQIYQRQSYPGLDTPAYAVDGTAMKNWWPFLFY